MYRRSLAALLMGLVLVASASAQKKKDQDEKTRIVRGTVTDAEDNPIEGAVVQLENAKTQQIRSFITRNEGTYIFHGLDPNTDYNLKASHQGAASPKRTLSAFDSRKDPVLNLKLEPKK